MVIIVSTCTAILPYQLYLRIIFLLKKRGTPNPVADYHAASYPKWMLTALAGQLPAKAVGWGSPLGSFRPITLYIT